MGKAAAMLEHRQTDDAAQKAEQDALDRLALVLDALKPEKPGNEGDNAGGGGGGAAPDRAIRACPGASAPRKN